MWLYEVEKDISADLMDAPDVRHSLRYPNSNFWEKGRFRNAVTKQIYEAKKPRLKITNEKTSGI